MIPLSGLSQVWFLPQTTIPVITADTKSLPLHPLCSKLASSHEGWDCSPLEFRALPRSHCAQGFLSTNLTHLFPLSSVKNKNYIITLRTPHCQSFQTPQWQGHGFTLCFLCLSLWDLCQIWVRNKQHQKYDGGKVLMDPTLQVKVPSQAWLQTDPKVTLPTSGRQSTAIHPYPQRLTPGYPL